MDNARLQRGILAPHSVLVPSLWQPSSLLYCKTVRTVSMPSVLMVESAAMHGVLMGKVGHDGKLFSCFALERDRQAKQCERSSCAFYSQTGGVDSDAPMLHIWRGRGRVSFEIGSSVDWTIKETNHFRFYTGR